MAIFRHELVMDNIFRGYLRYNILYPQCLDCITYKRIKLQNKCSESHTIQSHGEFPLDFFKSFA
jgi:hypothetical protein